MNIWRIMFWTGLITLFLWLVAKQVGLIHSPLIVDLLPYLSAIILVLGGAKRTGEYIQKIDRLVEDVHILTKDMHIVKEDIAGIKMSIAHLDKRLTSVETRLL